MPQTPRNKDSYENEKNKYISNIGTPTNRNNSNPMTPSARISALNIVSDLLRKVGVGIIFFLQIMFWLLLEMEQSIYLSFEGLLWKNMF